MKKVLLVMTLLFAFIAAPVHVVHGDGHNPDNFDYKSQEFKEIASQFMCLCGCGQDHFECNMQGCGLNDSFKAEIREMMDDGLGKDEIKDYYLNMYGEEILTAPERRGFSLVAWVLPFVALGGAGTGVFFVVRKWIAEGKGVEQIEANSADKDETEDEIVKSIIDEERKKYY